MLTLVRDSGYLQFVWGYKLPPIISLGSIVTASAACALGAYVFSDVFGNETLDLASLYFGVFDVFAIFTGFLTGIYAFVLTSSSDFIEKIRNTAAYKRFLSLVRWTILLCGVVSVLSLLIVVLKFGAVHAFGFNYLLVIVWVWVVAFSLYNIVRCFLVFGEVSGRTPQGRIRGN